MPSHNASHQAWQVLLQRSSVAQATETTPNPPPIRSGYPLHDRDPPLSRPTHTPTGTPAAASSLGLPLRRPISPARLTGRDNYGMWSVSTEIALKTLKAWKIINGVTLVTPDSYDDNPEAINAACREWLLETLEEDEVTTQKVTSNRKKFKKHLTDEYELWKELNGIALSEIYDSCTQSIQLLIGKKNATDVWKQLKSTFAVSGFPSVEQDIPEDARPRLFGVSHCETSLTSSSQPKSA